MARQPQGQPSTHMIGLAALTSLPCPGGEETLMWTKGGIACWEVGGRASQADAADKVVCTVHMEKALWQGAGVYKEGNCNADRDRDL